MRTLGFVIGVLVLVVGCLLAFMPGILTKPGANEKTLASEGATGEFEASLAEFFASSDGSDGDIVDSASRSSAASDLVSDATLPLADAADYETVFPEDRVQRIDLVISPEDWQAMLDEVASSGVGGRLGGAPGDPANVPLDAPEGVAPIGARMERAFVDACAGCNEGDEITVSLAFGEVSGMCVRSGEDLVFQLGEAFGAQPPAGMQPLDGRQLPEGIQGPEGTQPPEGAQRPAAGFVPGEGAFLRPDGVDRAGAPGGMMINETADASLTYVECTVLYEGDAWEHVGVRFKGNSTLRSTVSSGSWKYPLHLDFDEFEDTYPETMDQRFFGFDDLSLGNGATDSSLLRDIVPGEVFRAFGVPTPEMAHVRVYLDLCDGPFYLGVYTMVETPDDPFLEANFGSSSGNLYKPQGTGATWAVFDEASFAKKSNQDEEDWSDIEEAFEALHASRDDAAAWREGLEAVFDVDGFLRWLAINRLLGNWDAYGQMAQNYYLYSDPSDGLIHWIPWDLNQSLNARMQRGSSSIDPRSVGDQWPLIDYVLEDPVYFDIYVDYVADALATVYDAAALEDLVRETQEMLLPFLVDENGNLSEHSFLSSVEQLGSAGEQVIAEIAQKVAEAEAFLAQEAYEPTPIVITEIHYNPSPDQGPDEAYEFIELVNRGDATADLSGCRFDDGIYFTFPEGTTLAPGECLVLAKDASRYATVECRVLQWERGSLSNDGEVVRLVDADGHWIDRVAYGDDAPWPEACDGDGGSLVLIDPQTPNHLANTWAAGPLLGGSPGKVSHVD